MFRSICNFFGIRVKAVDFVKNNRSFSELWAILGLAPVMMYNGEKGKTVNKWLFYFFYSYHLILVAKLARMT